VRNAEFLHNLVVLTQHLAQANASTLTMIVGTTIVVSFLVSLRPENRSRSARKSGLTQQSMGFMLTI
jgi:hypothetical protein